jgi:hypothetical protein
MCLTQQGITVYTESDSAWHLSLLCLTQQGIPVYCVWLYKVSQSTCVWPRKASKFTVSDLVKYLRLPVSDSARHLSILCLNLQGISVYCVWHSKASQYTVSDSARHLSLSCLTQQGISVYCVGLMARHLILLCLTQQGISLYCVWLCKASQSSVSLCKISISIGPDSSRFSHPSVFDKLQISDAGFWFSGVFQRPENDLIESKERHRTCFFPLSF